jgi:lipoate-protein ligase A
MPRIATKKRKKTKPTELTVPDTYEKKKLIEHEHSSFQSKKSFSKIEPEKGCVLRKKRVMGSAQSRKSTRTLLQATYKMTIYLRRFKIVPSKKREDLIKTLDDVIQRLLTIISSKKTTTTLRLKAMMVLNQLISTSYAMIRDIEVEEYERETETLEEEARRSETEDSTEEESAKPA